MNAGLALLQRPRPGAGSGSRLVQLFSTSIVDQVLLSAGNFFIGFMLIRSTSDVDYGLFVLLQSTILLLTSAQGAMISGPVAVLAPKRPPEVRRAMIGAIGASHRRLVRVLSACGLLVPIGGYALGYFNRLETEVAFLGVIACATALPREYLRSVLLVYARPGAMLEADLYFVGVLVIGALLAVYGPKPAVLWAVGGVVLSSWIGARVAYRSVARDPGWVAGDAAPFWRELRPLGIWSGLGAVIYWSFGQSYNYILASRVNLAAVADVNAARLLLMPAFVVTIGIKGLLLPSAAGWLAESGLKSLLRRLAVFAGGVLLLDLMYFAVIAVFRGWLTTDLLHKHINDRDALLALWGCIAVIGLVRDVFQSALSALECFKPMAWLTASSALISLTLTWFGLAWWGPRAALIGIIAGELANLAGVMWLLRREYTLHSREPIL